MSAFDDMTMLEKIKIRRVMGKVKARILTSFSDIVMTSPVGDGIQLNMWERVEADLLTEAEAIVKEAGIGRLGFELYELGHIHIKLFVEGEEECVEELCVRLEQ